MKDSKVGRWAAGALVLLATVVAFGGCAGFGKTLEQPRINLADIRVEEMAGLETAFLVQLRVFNTICDATSVRQDEAREISGNVDLMLVIGGYNSANTTRLAHVCMEIQPQTHHIETAEEIDSAWFENVLRVGITAGASLALSSGRSMSYGNSVGNIADPIEFSDRGYSYGMFTYRYAAASGEQFHVIDYWVE